LKKIIFVALLALFLLPSSKAHAILNWEWNFVPNNLTVSSTDSVPVVMRIFNNSTAGETIFGWSGAGTSSDNSISSLGVNVVPNVFNQYDFLLGGQNLIDQLINFNLAAGESADLDLGFFTPEFSVTPGTYSVLFSVDVNLPFRRVSNTPQYDKLIWNVSIPHTPEPATMLLMFLGLAGSAFMGRFKSKV
jgi:hypothetical protein